MPKRLQDRRRVDQQGVLDLRLIAPKVLSCI